ncbi:hypothetical protein BBP40_002662 [Aspergillus hancockii]|nr:hypothetical protein BBP40_002662 [Aspergillus hancockii]
MKTLASPSLRGAAIPFTALASPPILTLSHIKALTQGTSQSFLDAWLNVKHLADTRRLEGEGTWLSRLKSGRASEKKVVYYGIDMWCLLYPEIWDLYETVNSVYLPVSMTPSRADLRDWTERGRPPPQDFTEVDRNVTKHLPHELGSDDWKGLVLHYPGLHNAAHFSSARSILVRAKQVEMDNVAPQIYDALERTPHQENTLFVLAGDHGMNETGTMVVIRPVRLPRSSFISPKFISRGKTQLSTLAFNANYEYYSVVNQVDVVPTLATLLGFSIPGGSVGVYIEVLLALFPGLDQQVRIMMINAHQMMNLFVSKHNRKAKQSTGGSMEEVVQFIRAVCLQAQQVLGVLYNSLNFPRLWMGIASLALIVLSMLLKGDYLRDIHDDYPAMRDPRPGLAPVADQSKTKLTLLKKGASSGSDRGILLAAALEVLNPVLTRSLGVGEPLDPIRPRVNYGVDSLVAVELRNWVRQEIEIEISALEILGARTLTTLCENLLHKLSK